MPNDLSEVIPQLLAQGLLALREMSIAPRLVNRRYEEMAGSKGSTIDVPIPSAVEAVEVAPSNTPPVTASVAPTSVPIVLDKWWEAPFYLTDKEIMESMQGTIPMQASEAIKSLANKVDSTILGLYTKIYGFYGTAGVTPFSDGKTTDATGVRKVLNKQLAPLDNRYVIFDPEAEASALNLRAFQDGSYSGDLDAIINGRLNRRLGFDWFMDQNVPTHTAGTITTGLAAKASTVQAAGLTTIVATTAASTGKCDLKVGDIIQIAGQSQSYVITEAVEEDTAATDVSLKISPPLKVALAGGEDITVLGSHTVNLAFHRDCIAFATRPLEDVNITGLGAQVSSQIDPVSGLALRLEVTREHKRIRYSYDILFGCQVVRPEFGARLLGTAAAS